MPPPKPDSHEAVRSADFFSASSRSEMALCIAGGTKRPMFVLNCTFNREHNKQ